MKLGNIAEIINGQQAGKDVLMESGDILLVNVGANIGAVCQYAPDQSAVPASTVFIIRSEEAGLFEKLVAKTEEIKSLAKGVAMPRLFIKDLKEFEL